MAIPSDLTVHPNLIEVALPTGGRAWVRRRLTHEQMIMRTAASAALTSVMPPEILTLNRGAPLDALAGVETAAIIRALGAMKTTVVAACVWGWEGVRSPDGDELASPADAGRMDTDDLDALYEAQEAAIVSADPNAGRGPSSPPSRQRHRTPAGRPLSMRPG